MLGLGLVAGGAAAANRRWPLSDEALARYPEALVLTDREDRPLRVRLAEDDLYSRPLDALPPDAWLPRALVAVEDKRFYRHHGVDPVAMTRAVFQNLAGRRVVSGASTLSTQVIRLLEPRPRTLRTKLIEAFRAVQLEARLTKDGILLQYLNRAPFGGNLVGAQAASRRYFGKDAADLSLAEAALLAGLPQSPSRLAPNRHPGRAAVRRAVVLDRMLACGMITPEQCAAARAEPVIVRAEAYPARAPHFSVWALERVLEGAGGRVRTTLDPGAQRLAEDALTHRAPLLRAQGVHGAAVVVVDVRAQALRAMVGSPDSADRAAHGEVNAAAARRGAGSTLKPFLYAWAADRGRMSPERRLMDVPRAWRGFAPGNFDGGYLGPVSARASLAMSLNLPALELAEELGPAALWSGLRGLGFDTLDRPPEQYGLALALGGAEIRLTALADACAALARGGLYAPSRWREDAPAAAPRRVFSEEAAWLVNDILSGGERAEEALGHLGDVELPRAAWKTGTSAGGRDAWCVVWNPDWVVAVWAGDPGGRARPGLSGGATAAPLAWELFRALHPGGRGPWTARPVGVQPTLVCAVSGQPPGPACGALVVDLLIAGVTARAPCAVHRIEWEETPDGRVARTVERWPAHVEAFLRAREAGDAPAVATGAIPPPPEIAQPKDGAVFRLTGVPGEHLVLRARDDGVARHWFVNGRPLRWTAPGESLPWPLERGTHTILCADASGRAARARITVE